ncbi:MAG: Trm112 family protein [Treponema sp.]|jgi:uncharacterized protein YbaR (Trm112 family)|nr:Trm112 family protein [Treponema sp.]
MEKLIDFLADPVDRGPLVLQRDKERLYNPRTRKAYPIRHGVPALQASDAEEAEGES